VKVTYSITLCQNLFCLLVISCTNIALEIMFITTNTTLSLRRFNALDSVFDYYEDIIALIRALQCSADTMTIRIITRITMVDLFLWSFHKLGKVAWFLDIDVYFQAAAKTCGWLMIMSPNPDLISYLED
jgi:hypothetical protein